MPDLGPSFESLHEIWDCLVKPKPQLLLRSLRRIFVSYLLFQYSETTPGFFCYIFLFLLLSATRSWRHQKLILTQAQGFIFICRAKALQEVQMCGTAGSGVLTECKSQRAVAFYLDEKVHQDWKGFQQRLCTPCLECQNEESFIHLTVFLTADVRQSPFCPLKVRITTGHAAAEGTVTPGVTPWDILKGAALLRSVRALLDSELLKGWCTALAGSAVLRKLCLDFWAGFNLKYSDCLMQAATSGW